MLKLTMTKDKQTVKSKLFHEGDGFVVQFKVPHS